MELAIFVVEQGKSIAVIVMRKVDSTTVCSILNVHSAEVKATYAATPVKEQE